MPDGAMIALAALHLERDFLFTALVSDDVGDHAGLGHGGRTHGKLAIFVYQQNAVESERLPSFNFQALDFQCIARGDTILFAASFQYCVHNNASQFKGRITKQKAEIVSTL